MASSLKYYCGIDFGTTNSATVSLLTRGRGKKTERITCGDEEGLPIPSVVAINKTTGEVITGREARDRRMELSESCIYVSSIKSVLSSDKKIQIAGRTWSAVDIACEVFKSLKQNVRDRIHTVLKEATVAIPVGFSPLKRSRLRAAAQKAGIEIRSFISEPTAAFFANYDALKSLSTVAIFDWGGGTLDVSILRHQEGKIFELSAVGKDVAGDYIDDKIAHRIHAKIARKKGMEIAFSDMSASDQDKMRVRAEYAKRMLSDDDTATVVIHRYGDYGSCRETIDYDWFVDIISPEVDAAMSCLDEAIHQSGVGLANIERIVMVGGSSNLRPLVERMKAKYGDKLFFPEETMWNVGDGAAKLAMNPGNYYSNQNIGIVLSDNSFFELLTPDVPIQGWTKSCQFGIVDSSKEARLVFSGSPDIDSSSHRFKVLEVPAYRFLQERIMLKAEIDQDMIFKVDAGSDMRPAEYHRVWEYPQLKFYYKLGEWS